jgi:hypothetical protein
MNESAQKPRRGEFRDENDDGSQSETETEDVQMPTPKVRTWDVLQSHPIAQKFNTEEHRALLCEFLDSDEHLQGMSLTEFIDAYFAAGDGGAEAPTEAADEVEAGKNLVGEPANNRDAEPAVVRPASMVGMRVVYRATGRNILSTPEGVKTDTNGVVSFDDIDGHPWSNVGRYNVYPIKPENYREIHISPREAKKVNKWLSDKKPVKSEEVNTALLNLFVDFEEHPDKIRIVVVNHPQRPYVDRFVETPPDGCSEPGFEDNQKPTERLMGEHCFRVRKQYYVVKVVSP